MSRVIKRIKYCNATKSGLCENKRYLLQCGLDFEGKKRGCPEALRAADLTFRQAETGGNVNVLFIRDSEIKVIDRSQQEFSVDGGEVSTDGLNMEWQQVRERLTLEALREGIRKG